MDAYAALTDRVIATAALALQALSMHSVPWRIEPYHAIWQVPRYMVVQFG
jgi:hypothetical protein